MTKVIALVLLGLVACSIVGCKAKVDGDGASVTKT